MLKLTVGSVWTLVEGDSQTRDWLHKATSVPVEGFVRGRFRRWYRYLYSERYKRFPSGLLHGIIRRAERSGVSLEITHEMSNDESLVLSEPPMWSGLYEYQQEAAEIALNKRRGILAIATGGGKTRTAFGIIERVDGPSLFLANEVALVAQSRESYCEVTGHDAGFIGDGVVDLQPVTFGTFQTVKARRKTLVPYLKTVTCAIFDECHVAAAKTLWGVAMRIPNAAFRIGLTATPKGRSDGLDAYTTAAIGPVIYRLGINDLTYKYGKLAKLKVIFYAYPGASEIHAREWHNVRTLGIVRCEARNRAIKRICKLTPKPVLVFYELKSHGRILQDMLESDFEVMRVDGSSSMEERTRARKALDRGDIDILLASKIFNQGTDIPRVKSCVNAAGMKANIPAIQRLGRGLRRVEGEKESVVFWDLWDRHHATLQRHSDKKKSTYEELGLIVFVTKALETASAWINTKAKRLKIV